MSKEGYTTIFGIFLLCNAAFLIAFSKHHPVLFGIAGFCVILLFFTIYFFRDPRRFPPNDPHAVLSPADGKVISIEKVKENEFFQDQTIKISIFLSIFDVHVNYTPYAGKVDFIQYKKGKFLPAMMDDASLHNVHVMTGLLTNSGKVAFKQSTGIIARRIVNHLKHDDVVQAGQKFGIIKFGSRAEVFLPLEANVHVKKGDKVRAAESILATL